MHNLKARIFNILLMFSPIFVCHPGQSLPLFENMFADHDERSFKMRLADRK
jgi:hypothetical protein